MKYTLKELRARNNLTQQEMANRLGISRQRYIKIEQRPADVTVNRMLAIADILNVEIGDIFLDKNHT